MNQRITALRTRLGPAALRPRLTLPQLATVLGVSRSYMEKLANGGRPITAEVEQRLIEAEGMDLGEARRRLELTSDCAHE
jgi:transcriptional regulator with XRE-family HTH domain